MRVRHGQPVGVIQGSIGVHQGQKAPFCTFSLPHTPISPSRRRRGYSEMDPTCYPCLESLVQRRKVSMVELPRTPKWKLILNIFFMKQLVSRSQLSRNRAANPLPGQSGYLLENSLGLSVQMLFTKTELTGGCL